jgi:hypothetical protein
MSGASTTAAGCGREALIQSRGQRGFRAGAGVGFWPFPAIDPVKFLLVACCTQELYLLVSTAARYLSSDSTSAGSATVSAISW